MSAHGFFTPPLHDNEPVKSYAPGTAERAELQAQPSRDGRRADLDPDDHRRQGRLRRRDLRRGHADTEQRPLVRMSPRVAPSTSSRRSSGQLRRTPTGHAYRGTSARRLPPCRRAPRRPVAVDDERGDDARPVEDARTRRRSTPSARWSTSGATTRLPPARLLRAAALPDRRSGTAWSTGRSRASSSPSAPSTSAASAATARRRPRSWTARSSGSPSRPRPLRLLPDAPLPGGRSSRTA